ncbi:MAG: ABC transporter permease [Rickettsiales bacterium]
MNLSPINRRRLANFKKNRRGYWSFWIFTVLFLVTLPAEFLANEQPIVVSYKNHLYFPSFIAYPEITFGGQLETEADYTDPFVKKQINDNGWMVMPPIPYNFKSINFDITRAPSPPSAQNWFGVDDQGRDVLARMIYGFRLSVIFALILTIVSSVIGIFAGAIQGYFGGKIDLLFQRFIEIWSGLPLLFLLIILSSLVEPTFWLLLGLLLLFFWVELVAVVRAEFLRARNFDYVRAAKALGVSESKIITRHVLPNAFVASLTFLPFILNSAITTLTSLDFLGFGLPPPSPSLGELLAQAKANPKAPWLGICGFMILAMLLSLLIFIGEAVRDALDPRKLFSDVKR